MSSGRVGKAIIIVLTCFFTAGYGRHTKLGVSFPMAGYGWHRSQWVNQMSLTPCKHSCNRVLGILVLLINFQECLPMGP